MGILTNCSSGAVFIVALCIVTQNVAVVNYGFSFCLIHCPPIWNAIDGSQSCNVGLNNIVGCKPNGRIPYLLAHKKNKLWEEHMTLSFR
jgi:hypothetical protein